MFFETIEHAGGTTRGTAGESHAASLLGRAVRRRYAVEATRSGGALITWTALLFGPGGESAIRAERSIRLAPFTPAGDLTDTVRADLARVDTTPGARYALDGGRRVIVGTLWRIPPFATARLRARHLVAEEDGRVRLTLAARLALLADAHRTRTTEPEGWYRPSAADAYGSAGLNRPGRRAGMLHSSASAAVCSCGFSASAGDRAEARRLASEHRRAEAAAFVALELGPARHACSSGV